MSRTGVTVRVLVDGQQLDDGCLPWNSYHWGPPWTEARRNRFLQPIPATAAMYPAARLTVTFITDPTGNYAHGVVSAAGTSYYNLTAAANRVPITPGTPVSYQAELRQGAGQTGGARLRLYFLDAAGTVMAGSVDGALENTTGVWKRSTVSSPAAPAGAAYVGVYAIAMNANAPLTYTLDIRKVQAEFSAAPGTYFDGSMAPAGDKRYGWVATVNASASVESVGTYTPDVDPDTTLPHGLSADDGLNITWGRTATVDQPAASTCTLRVIDDTQNSYFNSFRIGSSLQILADATITGGATVPAFTDPDFETELRAVTRNATATRDNRHVETGTMAAVLQPVDMGSPYSFQLPPGTLQAAGTNPNAWDNLPHLSPGETWDISVRLWVPQMVTVVVRALVYSGPYADAATVGQVIGTVTGAGAWATVSASVAPGVQMGWIGVQVEASGGQTWGQVPDAQTWAATPDTVQWRDYSDVYVDRVNILAPPGGSTVTILVFGGRITDMESFYDSDAPALDITATDFLGDLGNRYVGDEPWLVESLQTRFLRVLQLARVPGELPITADIATTLQAALMSWEDVDHRSASGLLMDMANSVDAVLWSATHLVSGPYVRLEDPAQRPALYQLQLVGGVIIIQAIDPATLPPDQQPLEISACDVLRDPVRWQIDVSDIATRATVTWLEQTLNDEGQPAPTERTLAVVDQPAEDNYGTRNISLQTLLTSQAAAATVADRLLARSVGEWRMSGLVVADADFQVPDQTAVNILLTLLDGVTRGGMAIRVTELPAWSPLGQAAPAYVEGGTYSYTAGGWELALDVSRASGLGQSAQWNELGPTWQWDQFDPAITWDDLRGVAGP